MGFGRLFQCGAGGKAAEARMAKISAYEAKKFGTSRDATAVTANDDFVKPDPSNTDFKRDGSHADPVAAYNSNTDDAMTNPVQSDEEDTESPEEKVVESEQRDQTEPTPFTSPLSVLSEQTAPDVTPPPRILEKLEDGTEQIEGATTEMNPTVKSAGLLCGCL